jgi:mono/diheme cytochrome c family protein
MRKAALALAALAAACGLTLARAAADPPPAPGAAPADPGLALIQGRCTGCHDTGFILQSRRTPDAWRDIVAEMIGRGAELSESEAAQVQAYLEKTRSAPAPAP